MWINSHIRLLHKITGSPNKMLTLQRTTLTSNNVQYTNNLLTNITTSQTKNINNHRLSYLASILNITNKQPLKTQQNHVCMQM